MAFLGHPFSSAIRQLKVIILFESRLQFWPFQLKSKCFKTCFSYFTYSPEYFVAYYVSLLYLLHYLPTKLLVFSNLSYTVNFILNKL